MHTWLSNIDSIHDDQSLVDLLLKSEEFKSISLRNEEISYLDSLHQNLLVSSIIDFDFDQTPQKKLLILVICFINYKSMPIFSLISDSEYIIENMKRLICGFKEILLYLRRFELFLIAFTLEKHIYHYKRINKSAFSAICTRIDENFVDLEIKMQEKGEYVVMVFNNNTLLYAYSLNGIQNHIFKFSPSDMRIEIHSIKNWDVYMSNIYFKSDLSLSGIYKYGMHLCDMKFELYTKQTSCPHFLTDFDSENLKSQLNTLQETDCSGFKNCIRILNAKNFKDFSTESIETYNNYIEQSFLSTLKLVEVSYMNHRERLRQISYLIYQLNLESVLIICPNNYDVNDTQQYLNTLQTMDDISNISIEVNKYHTDKSTYKFATKMITCFRNVKNRQRYKNIIFKGIYCEGKPIPVYDIFNFEKDQNIFVFDHPSNIEFLKYLLKR